MSGAATVIDVISGDLTTQYVDVIVNPCSARGGGGQCSSAIKKKWPEAMQDINMGTSRFCLKTVPDKKLNAKFVLHVNCSGGQDLIAEMLDNSLSALRANSCQTISFPIIGAGVQGRDYDTCAREMTDLLCLYFLRRERGDVGFVTEVRVVVFDPRQERKYERVSSAYRAAAGLSDQVTPSGTVGRGAAAADNTIINWSLSDRDSASFQRAVQAFPAELRGLVTSVQVTQSAQDAAADTLRRLRLAGPARPAADEHMPEADVVLNQRDSAGNLVARVGMRRQ